MSADFARTYAAGPLELRSRLGDARDELAACKQLLRRLAEPWELADGELVLVVPDCHGTYTVADRAAVSVELADLFKEVTA